MNEREFAQIALALHDYYKRDDPLTTDHARQLWFERLADLDYKATQAAVNKWAETNKWPPTIADIRGAVRDISGTCVADWSSGWDGVQRLIRSKGSYATREDMEGALDEISLKAVRTLGWQKICGVEGDPNPDADRANFRIIYEAEAKKANERAQMSPKLLSIIDGMKGIEKGESA